MSDRELAAERCVACRPDSPRLTEAEFETLAPRIPEWKIVERSDVPRLERVYRFPDFAKALAFTQRIGELAETEGHHPTLTTSWGRVKVRWWTHAIGGLHRNDVIMAAKSDQVYEGAT